MLMRLIWGNVLEILHEQTDKVALTQQQILSHRLQMLEQFVRSHDDVQDLLRCIQVHVVDHDVQLGVGNIGEYIINWKRKGAPGVTWNRKWMPPLNIRTIRFQVFLQFFLAFDQSLLFADVLQEIDAFPRDEYFMRQFSAKKPQNDQNDQIGQVKGVD